MTERVIVTDEWYPVYDLKKVKPPTREHAAWTIVDVPPELLADWKRVKREFDRLQKRLSRLDDAVGAKQPTSLFFAMTMASCASLDLSAPIVPYFPLDLDKAPDE